MPEVRAQIEVVEGWKDDQCPDRTHVPRLAEAMVAHGALPETLTEMQAIIDNDCVTPL